MVAVLGDPPAFPEGPPDWPGANPAVYEAVARAMEDGTWGLYDGPWTQRLEAALQDFYGVPYVFLTGSGTYAVELALRACGVSQGSEVILAAYDYPGNFLTVLSLQAQPVLVDVHPRDGQMDVDQVEAAITSNTRAIVASHLHGAMVDMRRLAEVADRYGVPVIEDAAQMPGAIVQGRRAGTWGHIGVISFGGSKLLTAGRGGAVFTSDRRLYQRIRLCGIRANNLLSPLSQLQAAAVLPQLERLEEMDHQRRAAVARLGEHLAGVPAYRLLEPTVDGLPGYYKVGIMIAPDRFAPLARDDVALAARQEGIAVSPGFRAAHVGRSPRRFKAVGELSNATALHHHLLVLHHPILLQPLDVIDRLAAALIDLYEAREAIARALK